MYRPPNSKLNSSRAKPKQIVRKRKAQPVLLDNFEDEYEFELAIFSEIKKVREKQGLSQRQLAQKIGIPQSSLARLESGKILNPTLTFLKKVLFGLGLELTVTESEPPKSMI